MKPALNRSGCTFAALGCAATMIIALIIGVAVLRSTFVRYRQTAANMEPTLAKGDMVVVRRAGTIRRGDLVVIAMPRKGGRAIMRVIALPGETVSMRDGVAVINGVALDEPYIVLREGPESPILVVRDIDPVQVPPDAFFVLGDNRDHANDSRFIGFVKRGDIQYRVVLVVSTENGVWRP